MTDNNRTLDLPEDIGLPFFAYGIFKPGQLAHTKIKNHVQDAKPAEINYMMMQRDGVPILLDDENDHFLTKGVVITFRDGQERDTYDIISKTMLSKLYKWGTVIIDGEKVNVMFGANPYFGSKLIKDPEERVDYDGKKDPFFNYVINLIENNLNSDNDHENINCFFKLQMNYMLLWSAIDRYASLKFNRETKIDNYRKFAKGKAFRDGIKKFESKYHEPVYTTDNLDRRIFNAEEPKKTLNYYYTFRCNVVHRGKGISDYSMLEQACKELLEIFKDVLEDTFRHYE